MTQVAHLVSRNVRPVFTHDCDTCVFLGSLNGQDLYYCPNDGSLIAREGNDGPAYRSMRSGYARQLKGNGSPYSLALKLLDRKSKAGRAFQPNAYRSVHNAAAAERYRRMDEAFPVRSGDCSRCPGCEQTDGEGCRL